MSKESNKRALKELIEIFYPNNKLKTETCYDWMGYEINEYNPLTLHHITKASTLRSKKESDETTIDNGACLGDLSHIPLHTIEKVDSALYNAWNDLFKTINDSRKEIDEDTIGKIKILQTLSLEALDSTNKDNKKEK